MPSTVASREYAHLCAFFHPTRAERDLSHRGLGRFGWGKDWLASGYPCFHARSATESADFPQYLSSMRLADKRLNSTFELVAKVNIDAGAGVSLLCFRMRAFHRSLSIS